MRLELFVLMGVVGLAIAVGQVEPQASSADPIEPQKKARTHLGAASDQTCQDLKSFLAEVEQVCPLRQGQRREMIRRLRPVCGELQTAHCRLWQRVQQLRNAPAGPAPDKQIESLQERCSELRARRDRIVLEMLDTSQRGRWQLAALLPRIQAELEGVELTPSQWEQLRSIGCRQLQNAAPGRAEDDKRVLQIVKRVYLEVLDSRQRREYAHCVQLRQRRRMNLARSPLED